MPDNLPVRRLLGPTKTPPQNVAPGTISWSEFAGAARHVDAFCSEMRAVPARIPLGDGIGPNAFLQAMRSILRTAGQGGTPPGSIEIYSADEYPAFTRRDDVRGQRFRESWSIFPPDFDGENVLETIRLQAWTAKPAIANA